MAKQVQKRRGTATEHNTFTGAAGEVTVNTTNDSLHVHDGATAGGFEAMRADYSNADTTADVTFNDLTVDGDAVVDGNLGIGTGSPDTIVEIVGADPILTIRDVDTSTATGNATIRFAESGGSDTLGEYWDVGLAPTSALAFSRMGNEAMRIDLSGNLLVGGTTAGATSAFTAYATGAGKFSTGSSGATANANADEVVVESSGSGGISIITPDAAQGRLWFGSPSDNLGARVQWQYSTGLMDISTAKVGASLVLGAADRVTNLTLSGASGSEVAEFAGRVEVNGVASSATSASNALAIKTDATLGHALMIQESGAADGEQWALGVNSDGSLEFYDSSTATPTVTFTDGAPANSMKLDSSGNLLVGKTSSSYSTQGVEIQPDRLLVTRSSGAVANFNRLTNDGAVAIFAQDGVEIGSLGTLGNEFQIKSNGSGAVSINRDVNDTLDIYRETATSADTVLGVISNVGGTDTTNLRIAADGDVTNTNNSYGAISDAKLKQDIEPCTDQLDDVLKLASLMRKYYLIADVEQNGEEAKKQIGWIAQEVREVCPGLVKETPDMERVEVTKTCTVERQVTETVTKEVERTEIDVVDGKAVQRTVTETVTEEVPLFDEIPLFHANGKPVMRVVQEAKEAVYEDQIDPDTDEVVSVLVSPAQEEVKEQSVHRVPRMETVEEKYTDYEERQIILEDGTPSVTLSIRHSIAFMKLFKAFGELADKVVV